MCGHFVGIIQVLLEINFKMAYQLQTQGRSLEMLSHSVEQLHFQKQWNLTRIFSGKRRRISNQQKIHYQGQDILADMLLKQHNSVKCNFA